MGNKNYDDEPDNDIIGYIVTGALVIVIAIWAFANGLIPFQGG